jgi:hypothetical protein
MLNEIFSLLLFGKNEEIGFILSKDLYGYIIRKISLYNNRTVLIELDAKLNVIFKNLL